ncbi:MULTISPECIES: DUF2304 domain-containing protein [Nitratiruptor]|uniref:DUF2304 domain-containing protein n=1 Tax=Nitratiruptor tergarcus DSM 16512 TaxID=1069081 RepID=A0A1W1WWB2_9BACT|nr:MULTISPECIES: DUF2304 domain-containing protein [Nitratiruptor]BCD62624.1 small membrane protein [Nitratiruptor sp. YY08-13]BCD66560.1 small membrane protein [Nitratiruptor sp. YY08-26]SMC10033.1 hypothetical protein SAMN05660197_1864 [Nitratiruptor tergarcus DSM 16512]
MIFVKALLIAILTAVFLLLSFSSRFRTYQRISVILFYLFLAFLILFPQKADKVAAFFGIGRGVDLVIYLSIAILSLIAAILYAKTKINERAITKIVRDIAIMKSRECNE